MALSQPIKIKERKLAMTRQVVGSMSEWSGVLKDIFRKVDDGSITIEMVKAFNDRQNPFGDNSAVTVAASGQVILPVAAFTFERLEFDTAAFLQAATKYFNERWGLHEFDPSGIKPSPHRPGFGWGILMPPTSCGVTAQKIFEKLGERFSTWKYTEKSLDEILDPKKEARQPGSTGYILWCRAVIEADECHKKKSASQIAKEGINPMGLAERLLLEDFVIYQEWAEHLDVKNVTLCAGSRRSVGSVPGVRWFPGGGALGVYWCNPGSAYGFLRAREVVS